MSHVTSLVVLLILFMNLFVKDFLLSKGILDKGFTVIV